MKTDPNGATNGSTAEVAENGKAEELKDASSESVAPANGSKAGEPAVEVPAPDKSAAVAAEEPAAEEPAAEEPAAEVGADEAPAAETDADEPAASADAEPAKTEATAEEPAAEEPAGAGEPAAGEPAGAGEPAEEPAEQAAKSGGFLADLVPPKTTKARVLVALILVALVGLGWGGYQWFTTLPEGVAFRVDGADVTEQQLEEQVQTLSALYGVQPPGPDDQARQDAFRRDVAKSTAVAMAVDNAAAERKIVVADRQASDFLTKYIAAQYGEGQPGREAFVKDLAEKNTSEPKVLAEIKRQMTLKELFGQVTADITVTDQDVRQTFDQRKDEFATPERREIHNIVVKTRPDADALLAELKAGGNFEALAPQRSLDNLTKNSGGNLGLVSARDLQKEYADAAFAAPVGGLIGPIETQQKSGPMFNVGKVVQSQPSVPADFEKIKDGVRRLVFAERADAKWRAFMEEQIKKSDIKYAEKYQPADPNGLPPIGNERGAAGQPAPPK